MHEELKICWTFMNFPNKVSKQFAFWLKCQIQFLRYKNSGMVCENFKCLIALIKFLCTTLNLLFQDTLLYLTFFRGKSHCIWMIVPLSILLLLGMGYQRDQETAIVLLVNNFQCNTKYYFKVFFFQFSI